MTVPIKNFSFIHKDEMESTQNEAIRLISIGQKELHGVIITTNYQTKGIGQGEKRWITVPNNFFATIILKNTQQQSKKLELCLLTANIIKEVVSYFREDIKIEFRWVNDLLIDGKKLAGILITSVGEDYVLIGTGVNLIVNEDIRAIDGVALSDYNLYLTQLEFLNKYIEIFKIRYNKWINTN